MGFYEEERVFDERETYIEGSTSTTCGTIIWSALCRCCTGDICTAEIVLAIRETYIAGRSPIYPNPRPYLKFKRVHTLGHVRFGEGCGGNTV